MKYLYIPIVLILLISCKSSESATLEYTANSEALKYFYEGWTQIMDEGRYSEAETSYRKAIESDPNFLVGKSVLARLTLDLSERLKLYEEIQKDKDKIKGDEKLVLDVYSSLVNYTNLRDQKSSETRTAFNQAIQLAEKNLKKVVHKYPEEVYLKSEYIEILHTTHGAKKALDSLNALATPSQKDNPFLLGVSANIYAEIKDFEPAMQKANQLLAVLNDSTLPKGYAVLASVYYKIGNLEVAKKNADRAFELDPKNLDASRLKNRIDRTIEKQNASN